MENLFTLTGHFSFLLEIFMCFHEFILLTFTLTFIRSLHVLIEPLHVFIKRLLVFVERLLFLTSVFHFHFYSYSAIIVFIESLLVFIKRLLFPLNVYPSLPSVCYSYMYRRSVFIERLLLLLEFFFVIENVNIV